MIDGFFDAIENIIRSPLRSFLTMLGVIIGVFSVVTLVSIGEGAKKRVADTFESMGTNTLTVRSGAARSRERAARQPSFRRRDRCCFARRQ